MAVVVVGTGITGRQLSSTKDAYFFRMQTWDDGDLWKILNKNVSKLRLEKEETVNTVANAVYAHPKLSALASNARSASFLVDSIRELSMGRTQSSWEMQLNEWTPVLVTQVVNRYIANNALADLNTIERRRVAATIFHALHKMKQGDAAIPSFSLSVLRHIEIPAAKALVQYNLEWGVDKPQIISGEDFAFTLTPAITMVLYSLAGVDASMVPGCKVEVEIAALYAVRHLILQSMERYESALNDGLSQETCREQLDESLGKIRLIRLRTHLRSTSDTVSVPMIVGSTVMIQGDMASFADVIAPCTFIQARRTRDKTMDVNLYDEVQKCGLLKENCNARLIRGLLAMWQGTIDHGVTSTPDFASEESNASGRRNPQLAKAFPENLLSLVSPPDPIQFATIHGISDSSNVIVGDGTSPQLPALDGTSINFIFSTNAERLRLKLTPNAETLNVKIPVGESSSCEVIITEANLNDDMQIDVTLLDADAKLAWTTFMGDKILEGAKVKFLFTV